jgi:hypothetical protein
MATAIVARIDELFAIDAEARCQGLNVEARHALRQQQSRPLLGEIRKQIEAARSIALPGGALAKACNYTLTLWDKLTRFLEYHELELSGEGANLVPAGGATTSTFWRETSSRRTRLLHKCAVSGSQAFNTGFGDSVDNTCRREGID